MKTIRLLPVLLVVAILAFALRVGEVVSGFRDLSGAAQAEEKKSDEHTDEKPVSGKVDDKIDAETGDRPVDDTKANEKSGDVKSDVKKDAKSDDKDAPETSWPDPADMDPDLAEVRTDLLKDLAARRKQLDEREKMLGTREAVMKAAEAEIDQKYRELTELRKQLQGLLNQQSEAEAERLKSLVRIYEGMKPADAARIFNTLDLSILLDVLTRMAERKSAPILAAMEADRARTITLMMAQQRKLPDLPELVSPEAGGEGNAPDAVPAEQTP